jgi:hypothetical protein
MIIIEYIFKELGHTILHFHGFQKLKKILIRNTLDVRIAVVCVLLVLIQFVKSLDRQILTCVGSGFQKIHIIEMAVWIEFIKAIKDV